MMNYFPITNSKILEQKWGFPWLEIVALIEGHSSIDLPKVVIKDYEDAVAYVKNYGYDPQSATDQKAMHQIIIEAHSFIERHLLKPPRSKPLDPAPSSVRNLDNFVDLLMMASGNTQATKLERAWACAILRLSHTISHVNGKLTLIGLETVKSQIQQRFLQFLARDKQGRLWFGQKPFLIELEHVEWKNEKTRDSIILKLLHKERNVAETIYDLIGVRIVTKHLCDVLLCVRFLRQFHIITFANAHPGRSRNTIIDLPRYQKALQQALKKLNLEKGSLENFENELREILNACRSKSLSKKYNKHSSTQYQSIQLTCRQRINTVNPAFYFLEKLKNTDHPSESENTREPVASLMRHFLAYVNNWPNTHAHQYFSGFFPFEIQILDKEAYEISRVGPASHESYKRSQIRAARKRVLGEVIKYSSQQ